MKKAISNKAVICIDFKKYRIRIYKDTLHVMEDPAFIQLLINPEKGIICIRRSISEEQFSQRIKWESLNERDCCEIYSRSLMSELLTLKKEWNANKSYRIFGTFNPYEELVWFDIEDAAVIDEEIENERKFTNFNMIDVDFDDLSDYNNVIYAAVIAGDIEDTYYLYDENC